MKINLLSCKCGCGEKQDLLSSGFRRGHWNKTIAGRERQSHAHVGIKCPRSVQYCQKMSERRRGSGNPMFGKKKSKKAIEAQRIAVSGPNNYGWISDRKEAARRIKQRQAMYGLLWRILRRGSFSKQQHTENELGYTRDQLISHLEQLWEPWMNWENHGRGPKTWQIDHIRPVNTFPPQALPSEVNALSNLRPLESLQNLRRSRKWNS